MTRRAPVALTAVLLAFAGCGIELQEQPVAIDSAALPPETAPAEAVEDEPAGTVLFLVAGDRLHAVERPQQPSLMATITALLEGPRETETAIGLRSAIPAGTRLLGSALTGRIVRLDLSEEFTSVVGEEHLLALAQLVHTATAATGRDRVQIAIEGEAVAVARGDGQLTTDPVGPEDYRSLSPP